MRHARLAALLAAVLAVPVAASGAEEAEALQKEHIAHLTAMGVAGKMVAP